MAVHTMEFLRLPFNSHSMGAAGQSKFLPLLWRQSSLSFFSLKQQHLSVLMKIASCEVCCSFLILLLENGNAMVLAKVDQGPHILETCWRPPAFSLPMMVICQLMREGLPWAAVYSSSLLSKCTAVLGMWCELLGLLTSIADIALVFQTFSAHDLASTIFESTTRGTRTGAQNPDCAPMTVQIDHPGAGRCSHMVRDSGNIKKQLTENKDKSPGHEIKCLWQCKKPVWGYVCLGSSSLKCWQLPSVLSFYPGQFW